MKNLIKGDAVVLMNGAINIKKGSIGIITNVDKADDMYPYEVEFSNYSVYNNSSMWCTAEKNNNYSIKPYILNTTIQQMVIDSVTKVLVDTEHVGLIARITLNINKIYDEY